MKNDKIIIINGREYYRDSGLPVKAASDTQKPIPKTAPKIKAVHSVAQRTHSMHSRTTMLRGGSTKTTNQRNGHAMDIARSKSISRFAPRATSAATKPSIRTKKINDKPDKPIKHPMAAKVERLRQEKNVSIKKHIIDKSTKQIKNEAIQEAMDKASSNDKPPKTSFIKRRSKYLNLLTVGVLLIVALGYLVYLNLPNISVTIASAQAGINASYPEYLPDGYGMDGPVSYTDGEVSIKFRANGGQTGFTIKQSRSSWDSSAVKMQIDKESNGETTETKEKGRTIYTYDDNTKAAWVNGGILYTISGDAKLSGEQIRHIATGL